MTYDHHDPKPRGNQVKDADLLPQTEEAGPEPEVERAAAALDDPRAARKPRGLEEEIEGK